jgi:hypothetical protein
MFKCNPQVQFWGGRIQLMGQLAPSRPFSYLMFGGALAAPDVPYRLGGGREAAWQVGRSHNRQAHSRGTTSH